MKKVFSKIFSFACVGYTFCLKNRLYDSLNTVFRGYIGGYTGLHGVT